MLKVLPVYNNCLPYCCLFVLYNMSTAVDYGMAEVFWFPSPNKFSNNFGAIGGRSIGIGAMKLAIFSWTWYLELRYKWKYKKLKWTLVSRWIRKGMNTLSSGFLMHDDQLAFVSLAAAFSMHKRPSLKANYRIWNVLSNFAAYKYNVKENRW